MTEHESKNEVEQQLDEGEMWFRLMCPEAFDGFEKVLAHSATLPDTKSRIAYLIEEKANWLRENKNYSTTSRYRSFAEKCQLEIEKYWQLIEIDNDPRLNPTPAGQMKNLDTLKGSCSIDQAILLLFAMCGYRIKGLDRGKVADGISFLTGYSAKQIRKRFSEVLPDQSGGIKKFNNQTDAYNKDVAVVADILSRMGLPDEAEKLRQDSGV